MGGGTPLFGVHVDLRGEYSLERMKRWNPKIGLERGTNPSPKLWTRSPTRAIATTCQEKSGLGVEFSPTALPKKMIPGAPISFCGAGRCSSGETPFGSGGFLLFIFYRPNLGGCRFLRPF